MLKKKLEICPKCGKPQPFKVYATISRSSRRAYKLGPREARRQYVRCRACGAKYVISTDLER